MSDTLDAGKESLAMEYWASKYRLHGFASFLTAKERAAHTDLVFELAKKSEELAAVTKERDELRSQRNDSEILAKHSGGSVREWWSGGVWLYPGDSLRIMSEKIL